MESQSFVHTDSGLQHQVFQAKEDEPDRNRTTKPRTQRPAKGRTGYQGIEREFLELLTEDFVTRRIQGYGWKPSLPDPRDIIADTSELPILAEVDPRQEYMTKVYAQLRLGSCTSNAVAAAIDADCIVSGDTPKYPSRLWIYALE